MKVLRGETGALLCQVQAFSLRQQITSEPFLAPTLSTLLLLIQNSFSSVLGGICRLLSTGAHAGPQGKCG